jgi:hypothetical protein
MEYLSSSEVNRLPADDPHCREMEKVIQDSADPSLLAQFT